MAKGTASPQARLTQEQEFQFDPGEIILLPVPVVTYKALADAAMRDGLPMLEFMQTMFSRAIQNGVRGK